jgi:Putative restriction endonuclease
MSLPYEYLITEAERFNVRLEIIAGATVWEASPVFKHQWEVKRIASSLQPQSGSSCECIETQDTLFKFPDGSLKRPDIAVLRTMPDLETADVALELIPTAVVEIISKNYEYKDFVLAPPFYLSQGVRDILIFNPADKSVLHYRPDLEQPKTYISPITLNLECGCEITV